MRCSFLALPAGVALAAAMLAGCGGHRHAAAAASGCVPAPMHSGRPPAWTAPAFADSSPGFSIPYALSDDASAAAFYFAPVLRAGHPENPSNKILWVVRFLRDGNPLDITARQGGRIVHLSFPDNSAPGEIYPSGIDLPTPGCWSLALQWGKHRTHIDVRVVS